MVRSFVQAVCVLLIAQTAAAVNIPRQTTESFPTIVTSKLTGPPNPSSSISVIPIITGTGPPLSESSSITVSSSIPPVSIPSSLPPVSSASSGSSSVIVPSGSSVSPSTPPAPSSGSTPTGGAVMTHAPIAVGFVAVVGAILGANLV